MSTPSLSEGHVNFSETIPYTPIASLDPALNALKDIRRQVMTTLLTLVLASNIPPSGMTTIMARPQVLDLRRNLLDWRWAWGTGLSGDDLRRSRQEPVFIPLGAGTGFPALATDIAELGTAIATVIC